MSAKENQALKQVLREHELKATSQRIALLKLLNGAIEHFDAEEIYLELRKRQKMLAVQQFIAVLKPLLIRNWLTNWILVMAECATNRVRVRMNITITLSVNAVEK